jgi:probable HAF family extracellular repeat protein
MSAGLPSLQPRPRRRRSPISRYLAALLAVLALALTAVIGSAGQAAAAKIKPTPAPTPLATPAYTVTDLGSLGLGITHGLAINATGEITGYSYLSTEFQVTCPPQRYGGPTKCFEHPYHAFLWGNGVMTDLGTLGGHFSQGVAINSTGEIVGQADTTSAGDAFLWTGTKMTDLGSWNAQDINDSGQISGGCQQACVYQNGKFTPLPNPSGLTCNCGLINNAGDVTGGCTDSTSNATGKQYIVLWQGGTPTDLGNLGGPAIRITALNEASPVQVTGFGQDSTDANHAFLWSSGTLTDIGAAFYPDELYPTSINDHGVIVGGPFIWSNGTLQNLNNLVPQGSGFTLDDATGINDTGQILVNGSSTGGAGVHAFLLTPTH